MAYQCIILFSIHDKLSTVSKREKYKNMLICITSEAQEVTSPPLSTALGGDASNGMMGHIHTMSMQNFTFSHRYGHNGSFYITNYLVIITS